MFKRLCHRLNKESKGLGVEGIKGFALSALCLFMLSSFLSATGSAQEPFYKGKTIRIVVGFTAGGGYDMYSRLIARHMGKHIPGNPAIMVENMAGAGSLIAANHVYKVAKPDGLTIGNFNGGLFLQQLEGRSGIEFDARRFEYIGAPSQDNASLSDTKTGGWGQPAFSDSRWRLSNAGQHRAVGPILSSRWLTPQKEFPIINLPERREGGR